MISSSDYRGFGHLKTDFVLGDDQDYPKTTLPPCALNLTRHRGGGPGLIGPNLVCSLGEGGELRPFHEVLGCVTVLNRLLPPWTGVHQMGRPAQIPWYGR